jgi:UDP-N-acetylmuramoyl-L-alanyl-D-glutamate--2,6-diaminopimelate ligase
VSALRPRTRQPVSLSELLGGTVVDVRSPLPVSGITLDSRLVSPGDLYVALPGSRHHGADFAAEAAEAGASAILTDTEGGRVASALSIPVVVVDQPRRLMAGLAAQIYGRPAQAMTMFAVTGTNGKTTTTFLLEAALQSVGVHTGLIGTIGFRLDQTPLGGARTTVTTPESTELQALLALLRENGAEAVLMEVSSHALVLGRADAITFDVSAFTNLGRDHLDFHGDEQTYFEAKASLFSASRSRQAVISIDDAHGRELAERIRRAGELRLTTVSMHEPADWTAAYEVRSDGRTAVRARHRDRTLDFILSLPGDFNVRNALTALAMIEAAGLDADSAAAGLADAVVPGRMQRVEIGPDAPVVYVDFAHTPQAVAASLSVVGTSPESARRIVVLGCGGDRDPEKRGPMGAAAARGADVVIVTDDNPRSEDAAAIRAQILAGARAAVAAEHLDAEVIDGGDRRAAIGLALEVARPGDVVAVLGKGHETGQEVAGKVLPFGDPAVVHEQWAARRVVR